MDVNPVYILRALRKYFVDYDSSLEGKELALREYFIESCHTEDVRFKHSYVGLHECWIDQMSEHIKHLSQSFNAEECQRLATGLSSRTNKHS